MPALEEPAPFGEGRHRALDSQEPSEAIHAARHAAMTEGLTVPRRLAPGRHTVNARRETKKRRRRAPPPWSRTSVESVVLPVLPHFGLPLGPPLLHRAGLLGLPGFTASLSPSLRLLRGEGRELFHRRLAGHLLHGRDRLLVGRELPHAHGLVPLPVRHDPVVERERRRASPQLPDVEAPRRLLCDVEALAVAVRREEDLVTTLGAHGHQELALERDVGRAALELRAAEVLEPDLGALQGVHRRGPVLRQRYNGRLGAGRVRVAAEESGERGAKTHDAIRAAGEPATRVRSTLAVDADAAIQAAAAVDASAEIAVFAVDTGAVVAGAADAPGGAVR